MAPVFIGVHTAAMLTQLTSDKRTVDAQGFLHVSDCKISKANVCPYFGREIPGYLSLGLDANRVYMMYRTPELLQAAAESFNNVPLTVGHVPMSVDAMDTDSVGGTVSNARFEMPYLVGDIAAWTRKARDGIEKGDRRELSCAYRYTPNMIRGVAPDGVSYDGRMEPPPAGVSAANHVALVREGRAGPDVLVADEAHPMTTKSRFVSTLGAVLAALVTPAQLQELDKAHAADSAADAFPELDDKEKAAACDAAKLALGKDSLNEEETRAAYQRAAKDKKPAAMDAAALKLATDAAVAEATKDMVSKADAEKLAIDAAAVARADVLALVQAREDVADKVGVVALDSAPAVYRFALDKAKISHADVPDTALRALYLGVKDVPIAADAKGVPAPKLHDLFAIPRI